MIDNENLKLLARELRKNQTNAEQVFWNLIGNRKINNKKFLRQHPIVFKSNYGFRFFIADFYCAESRLIIEIDGEIHEKQKDYDLLREDILKSLDYKILRFKNENIVNSSSEVIKQLQSFL